MGSAVAPVPELKLPWDLAYLSWTRHLTLIVGRSLID